MSKYFLKAALNFTLSFLRIVRLGGKLLKIFFCQHKMFFFGNKVDYYLVYKYGAYSLY